MEEEFSGLKGYAEAFLAMMGSWVDPKDWFERVKQVDDSVREMSKGLGVTSDRFGALKVAISDSVVGVAELGGELKSMGEVIGKIVEIQSAFATSLGRNVTLSADLTKELYAASKATGADVGDIVTKFKDVGVNTMGALDGMQQVVDTARRSGVNATAVSKEVLANMSKMNQFTFQGGVEGLAKMASQAVSLRINMDSTMRLAEKLFNPEDAIEMAAAMQRLGVTQSSLLDPLRLMDLAQNDPAELQNQIVQMSEQFTRLNEKGQFEIMPGARRQLMAIADAMGMNYNEITRMALGSAELGKKMSEIRFPPGIADEDTRKMIANMAEMSKDGQYKVTFTTKEGETVTKSVTQLDPGDIELLAEQSKPKTMEEIAKDQLTMQQSMETSLRMLAGRTGYALAPTRTATEGIEMIKKGFQVPSRALSVPELSTKNIREKVGPEMDSFINEVKKLSEGKGSFTSIIETLGKTEQNMIKFGDEAFKGVTMSLKTDFDSLGQSTNRFAVIMSNFIKKFTDYENMTSGGKTKTTTLPQKDFIIPLENDDVRIYDDAIVGGTSLTETKVNPRTIPVKDFIIPLQEDQLRVYDDAVLGGTNLGGNMTNQMSKTEMTIDFNLNITSNTANINTNELMVFMEKQEFKQKMMSSIKEIVMNGKTGQIGNVVSV